jgi:hypothetical protein
MVRFPRARLSGNIPSMKSSVSDLLVVEFLLDAVNEQAAQIEQ